MKDYEVCQNCKFWYRVEDWPLRSNSHGNGKAECRSDPPLPLSDGERYAERVWPMTHCDDWCGKFEPREEES